ncbi:MAG TPA: hypothetical protein VME18_10560 [Acidobacteriaceae bacterium]|nr:hypothetical protein [Acidobacteriaceae bacterium]
MGNENRPDLTLQQQIAVEAAQNDVDGMFWESLWHFQALTGESGEDNYRRNRPSNPPAPKEPAAFKWVAGEYARNLFIAESERYPESPDLQMWLESLRERTMDRATQLLDKIEDEGAARNRSFGHHGVTPDELLEAMGNALDDEIQRRLSRSPILLPPLPPGVTQQMRDQVPAPIAATTTQGTVSNEPEVERREKLLTDYKAATGASNRQIFMAQNSGIHKPQFVEWRRGELPDTSATTQNFERFLREKKPPIPRKPKP